MIPREEDESAEYAALMSRARDVERTAQFSWVAAGLAAAVLLSWAIGGRSPGLMLPVVLAVACGFYAALQGRQELRLISGYMEEIVEAGGSRPGWFSRLRQLHGMPGFSPSSDWIAASLANAVVLLAVALAWVYVDSKTKGELLAGIVTGCGVAFAFHSLTETSRMTRTNFAAVWRQGTAGTSKDARRIRAAS